MLNMRCLLFFIPFLGWSQAIDLSLVLKPKGVYKWNVVSEVSSKQRVDQMDVAVKATSHTLLSLTPAKEEKQLYSVSLRYEAASLEMETQVQGKHALGKNSSIYQ